MNNSSDLDENKSVFRSICIDNRFKYRKVTLWICRKVIKQSHQPMKEYKVINIKIKAEDKCIHFYHKSNDIFVSNVEDNICSLVDNIYFSQL